jgi:micrococcal nuclease
MKRSSALFFCVILFFLGFFAGKFLKDTTPSDRGVDVLQNKSSAPHVPTENFVSGVETALVSRVIDGDTVELSNRDYVRYIGADSPETVDPRKPVQCFGVEATRRNKELVEGKSVRLEKDVSDRDKYGRLLRYVYLQDGTFVNLELIKEGYAAASIFPPDVKYADVFNAAEKEARGLKRGLWNSCPLFGSPATSAASSAVAGSEVATSGNNTCVIKGNISSDGEKIYHLPGCAYYDKTRIDEARGERWFCSEAEAVAAGWRKAQNCQ